MIRTKPSVLIISFFFPPYPNVGGRRWAKLSKLLNRNGYDVHVLCAKFKEHKSSPWDIDVVQINNISRIEYVLKDKLYKRIDLEKANFIQKLLWHLSNKKHEFSQGFKKLFFGKNSDYNKHNNSPIDLSIGKEKDFLKKAIEIIQKNNIKKVVLSAGPFSYAHFLASLKNVCPNTRLPKQTPNPKVLKRQTHGISACW